MATVDTERRGRVAIIRMRRPDHGNRVSQEMAEDMVAALETARRSTTSARCVLTGHGDVFCLGGDYQGAGPTGAGRHAFARAFMDMAQAIARLGKPIIAAVNGNAHAGGFSLVVACDMAVVAEGATLGLPEVAKGLAGADLDLLEDHPACRAWSTRCRDAGGLHRLPHEEESNQPQRRGRPVLIPTSLPTLRPVSLPDLVVDGARSGNGPSPTRVV